MKREDLPLLRMEDGKVLNWPEIFRASCNHPIVEKCVRLSTNLCMSEVEGMRLLFHALLADSLEWQERYERLLEAVS